MDSYLESSLEPQIERKFEELCLAQIEYKAQIRKLAEDLTDEEVMQLVDICRKEAKPGPSKNFAMPEWDEVASILSAEIGLRHIVAEMKEKGLNFYCVHCRGEHTPEHIAELQADDD